MYAGRLEIRNVPGADWMVDEVLRSIHTKYVDRPLCYYFPFVLSMIKEASKVEHAASYKVGCWWLLAAVFVSAASAPHLGAFEVGGTLSE